MITTKRNFSNRFLSVLLAVVMLVSMLPITVLTASAEETEQYTGTFGADNKLTWVFDADAGTLTISGNGSMGSFSSTNQPWVDYKSLITKVEIEEGVTTIGNYAFYKFAKIQEITLPTTVTSIGVSALQGTGVRNITIPDGVTKIGDSAFRDSNITSIVIPASVTQIGGSAFQNAYRLKTVEILGDLTAVGNYAFYNCSKLESITFHGNADNFGNNVFWRSGSKELTINYWGTTKPATYGTNLFQTSGVKIYVTGTYKQNLKTFLGWGTYATTDAYSITVTSDENGTASADASTHVIGETVTLTAIPNDGYRLKEWQVVSGRAKIKNDAFLMPAVNVEIKAIFELAPTTYTVSFEAGDGEGEMDDVTVNDGEKYTLPTCTFTAPENKQFKAWSINGTEYVAGTEITVTNNITVTALWEYSTFKIATLDDLLTFKALVEGGETGLYAELTADIDMSSKTDWDGIGGTYTGTFDGKGYTISNLTGTMGLFTESSGTVKNIYIKNAAISGGGNNGAVVGHNTGTVFGCVTSGSVYGSSWSIGGIVGYNEGGTVSGCISSCSVDGPTAGGLVGSNWGDGNMIASYYYGSTGKIEGDSSYGTQTDVFYQSGTDFYKYKDAQTTAETVMTTVNTYIAENGGYFKLRLNGGNVEFDSGEFTVTFDANGGTGTMSPVTVKSGDTYTLPGCGFEAPENKLFKAWKVNGTEYAVGDTISVTGNITVKAVWRSLHVHPVCGAACGTDHDKDGTAENHAQLTWAEWDGTTTVLAEGNYYLTDDIEISSTITVTSGTVNLCLNGHTLTLSSTSTAQNRNRIKVSAGATLNICDCIGQSEGIVFDAVDQSHIDNYGTLNLYGISLSNTTNDKGTSIRLIYTRANSVTNLYGCTLDSYNMGIYTKGGEINIIGGSITADRNAIEHNGGNVTIWDNAVLNVDGTDSWSTIALYAGTVNLKSGTVKNDAGSIAIQMQNSGEAKMNISGGSVTTGGKSNTIYVVNPNAEITITGGSVSNTYSSVSYSSTDGRRYGWGMDIISCKSLTLSGNPSIDKIYLAANQAITIGKDGLNNETPIGIYCRNNPQNVTGQNGADYSACFKVKYAADNYYTIINQDNIVKFVKIESIEGSVSIEGNTVPGQTLTAVYTSEQEGETVTYQWYRGNEAIDGATDTTYTVQTEDLGKTLKVVVTGTGAYKGTVEDVTETVSYVFADGDIQSGGYSGQYDGLPHGITVTAPEGATVAYGTAAGTYDLDASPTLTDVGTLTVYWQVTKENYKTVTGSADVTITNNWKPTEYTVSTPNANGWLKEDFVITAKDGYELSLTNTAEGEWKNSLVGAVEGKNSSVTFYVRNKETGAISLAVTEYYKLDKNTENTDTTGKVYFDELNGWEKFLDAITFGLFYKDEVTVKVDAVTDALSGVQSIEYIESDKALTLDEVVALDGWTVMPENGVGVTLADTKQFVYYVRITDKAGNVTYLSTDGAEYDTTAPAIDGIENGATYYTTQKVTVTDKNLDTVTLNDEAVTGTITLDGNTATTYTIVATDKAGNTTTYTVTMAELSDITADIDDVKPDSVTSADKDDLQDVIDTVDKLLKDDENNLTDDERKALEDIKDEAQQLIDKIDEAADATETENTEKVKDKTAENVTPEDKTDLENAKADLEKALEDYDDNYTDDEKKAIEDDIKRIDDALDVIENVEAVEELIDKIPENITKNDEETIKAADDAYNALSDYEKSLVDEDAKKALDDAKAALAVLNKPADPNSPQTGDTSNLWLWFALLFVSGSGIFGITVYDRKRKAASK